MSNDLVVLQPPAVSTTLPMPAEARIAMRMRDGLTIAEIVAAALPALAGARLDAVRVTLVARSGMAVIPRRYWHRVRPHAGTTVILRVVPQGGSLKSILSLALVVASIAIGNFLAPIIAGSAFGAGLSVASWQAIIGVGVLTLGTLAINALIPPPSSDAPKPLYQISGWRNDVRQDGIVPCILGKMRYAPPFAGTPHTEIIDGVQYFCGTFCFGYGPVELSSHRIGDTPIDQFDDVEMQIREGGNSDDPITLFPRQIVEEAIGTELVRPLVRDDEGNIVDEDADGTLTPVKRTLARDSVSASVILVFPAGLVHVEDDGNMIPRDVEIRMRARVVGTSTWTFDKTITVTAETRDPFYRQANIKLPTRGDYELEVTRMTNERISLSTSDRVQLVAIQSVRPEYGLDFGSPLALVAIRIKASYQLQGALDSYNAVVSRKAQDYDHDTDTWALGETRNPAALYRYILAGNPNAKPADPGNIDLGGLADWHDFCRSHGLHYDRMHDFEGSLIETLQAVAAAGRAAPRYDGRKWSVVIDRPQTVVVDHINPRNSAKLSWQRNYFTPPHAFRVQFLDATNNYEASERLVRWPGYSGDITVTEEIDLPGKVNPDEVWREARRRQNELLMRPDLVTVTMDGAARVAVRGDLVMVNYDVLARTQKAARVRSRDGAWIDLDDVVAMDGDESYAIRWRRYADDDDVIGTSIVKQVATMAGEHGAVQVLDDDGPFPNAGDIVHFGLLASESAPMIVKSAEPAADGMVSIYELIAPADAIDEATDDAEIPAWTGRFGTTLDTDPSEPAEPVIKRIRHGEPTGDPGGLIVLVEAGRNGTVRTWSIEIDHKLALDPDWTTKTIDAADGGATISAYSAGDAVQLRARGLSEDGVPGPYTSPVVNVTI
jgi:hypothetical protein